MNLPGEIELLWYEITENRSTTNDIDVVKVCNYLVVFLDLASSNLVAQQGWNIALKFLAPRTVEEALKWSPPNQRIQDAFRILHLVGLQSDLADTFYGMYR